MEQKHLLTLMAILLFSFISCKKDESKEDEILDALAKQVQWKWQVNSIITKENFGGTERSVTYEGQPADYIDFRTDGKMYTSFRGILDTADYFVTTIDNDRLININKDNVSIKELSDQSMKLHDKEVIVNFGSVEITYYLKR